jgi:alpha 1,2-mannosyltransferase
MSQEEEGQPFLGLQGQGKLLRQGQRYASAWTEKAKALSSRLHLPKAAFTRKYILIAVACLVVSVTLLLPTTRHGISRAAGLSTTGICSTTRQNPHGVRPPNPDIARLTHFWPDLRQALHDGGKDLPRFDKPPYVGPNPPSAEDIRNRGNDISREQATKIRELNAQFVRSMPKYPTKTFKGRGVVVLAGWRYSEYAVIGLGMLREAGSKLPVEVWHRDEREEKSGWCQEMQAEGMVCRRMSDYIDTDILELVAGYQFKIFTMLFSSFEEVVFIDADNMALQPPELLFETKAYKDTGVILWHDYWKYDNVDWLDYAVGLADDRNGDLWNQTNYESGEMVWHKRRNWDALLLAVYYNYYGPDLYYTLLNYNFAGWGDKDTFPLAFRTLKKPFHTVAAPPADAWERGKIGERRVGMLQMMPDSPTEAQPDGAAAFLHATTVKWSYRDFVCDRCLPIWHTDSATDKFVSSWEDDKSDLYPFLHGNLSIIEPEVIEYMPTVAQAHNDDDRLGLEIRLWRAMEYAACRSPAWRHERSCTVARRYMIGTFGFRFVLESAPEQIATGARGDEPWLPNMEAKACLLDPA